MKQQRLPPGCGADLGVPLLANPYQQAFQTARRMRFCLNCHTMGSMNESSQFTCQKCGMYHVNNLTAPRVFDRFLVLAGRGGGKTLIGAHAAREEMMVPGSIGWVMGPTYKILHDSTFPTLVRLIPPEWVERWDSDNMEIILRNKAMVAFRSLEDPERARGPHGVNWGWFDEAAQAPERAYDVFEPTLIKAGGIIICTTTVLGYDWTYDKIEARAKTEPGFWAIRYWTEENPLFKTNPTMMKQIERAKKINEPAFYAQEYQAERRNAQGLVYDYELIEKQCLLSDEEVRKVLPEWPKIDSDRKILIGLDSGIDHPFGAVMFVVTERGLIAVKEYLKRQMAQSLHLAAISQEFGIHRFKDVQWSANKNEANLRLEWGLRNIVIVPAENKHEIGIQRVSSWLHARQLFLTHHVPLTIQQLRAYRYANNYMPDDQKKDRETVFKKKDELPDAVRYAVMAWPELPKSDLILLSPDAQSRWDAMSEKTKRELEVVREYNKRQTQADLATTEAGYPTGDFFSVYEEHEGDEGFGFGGGM
jgi:hypothetical protein